MNKTHFKSVSSANVETRASDSRRLKQAKCDCSPMETDEKARHSPLNEAGRPFKMGSHLIRLFLSGITVLCLSCDNNATTGLPGDLDPVEIIHPKGGETYNVGETVTVEWRVNDPLIISSIGIALSLDNGKSFPIMLANRSFSPEITSISWKIESDQSSDYCIVKVYNYTDGSINDKSNTFIVTDR